MAKITFVPLCLRVSNALEEHFDTAFDAPEGIAKYGLCSYIFKECFRVTSIERREEWGNHKGCPYQSYGRLWMRQASRRPVQRSSASTPPISWQSQTKVGSRKGFIPDCLIYLQ